MAGRPHSAGFAAVDLVAVAGLIGVAIFFAAWHDLFRNYLSHLANQGTVYQALLINDGLKQEMHDHTGYIYYLLVAGWYRLLHALSVLDVIRLSDLPGPDAFEPYYASLVYAARALSATLVAVFAAVFYFGILHLTRSRAIAMIAALVTVSSPGFVEVGAITIRSDMTAALFVYCAFFLGVAASGRPGWRGIALLGGAAFSAWLAIAAKMQVVPLVLALPVLLFAFDRRPAAMPSPAFSLGQKPLSWAFIFFAAAAALPALTMLWGSILFWQSRGGYQALIAGYFLALWLAYGIRHRLSWYERLLALAAVMLGFAMAHYSHLITGDMKNSLALGNFLEWMSQFTHTSKFEGATLIDQSFSHLLNTIDHMIPRMFISLENGNAPLAALYGVAGVGAIGLLIAGQRRMAAQVGLLWLTAFGMEVFSAIKSWKLVYHIFVLPWLAIATAVLASEIARLTTDRGSRRRVPTMSIAFAMAIVAVFCLAENFRLGIAPRRIMKPHNICGNAYAYLHRIPHHFDRYCPGTKLTPSGEGSFLFGKKGGSNLK